MFATPATYLSLDQRIFMLTFTEEAKRSQMCTSFSHLPRDSCVIVEQMRYLPPLVCFASKGYRDTKFRFHFHANMTKVKQA